MLPGMTFFSLGLTSLHYVEVFNSKDSVPTLHVNISLAYGNRIGNNTIALIKIIYFVLLA